MKVYELIEKLQQLPQDVHICVFDWKRNVKDSDSDGTAAGIYMNFDVEMMDDENLHEDSDKFAVIAFENEYIEDDVE